MIEQVESHLNVYDVPAFAGENIAKEVVDEITNSCSNVLYERYLNSKVVLTFIN